MTNIQVKRGNEANLPTLNVGEPALTLDSERVFIGAPSGNKELAKQVDVNQLTTDLAKNTSQLNSVSINVMYPPAPLVGAKGDWNGTTGTDDTSAIQGVINFVKSNGGGIVFFPPKTFKYSSLSIIRSSSDPIEGNIVLQGSIGTILASDKTQSTAFTIKGYDNGSFNAANVLRRIFIRDIEFRGDYLTGTNIMDGAGIELNQVQKVKLENVMIRGYSLGALNLKQCWDSEFNGVEIYTSGKANSSSDYAYALKVTRGYDNSNANHFVNCHIEQCPLVLFSDQDARQNYFTNCKFEHGSSVVNNSGQSPIAFADVISTGFSDCIFTKNSQTDEPFITVNNVQSSYQTTIKIDKSVKLTGCHFEASSGIYVNWLNVNYTEIENCTFNSSNGGSTIYPFVFGTKVKFKGANKIIIPTNDTQTFNITGNYNQVEGFAVEYKGGTATKGAFLQMSNSVTNNRIQEFEIIGTPFASYSIPFNYLDTNIIRRKNGYVNETVGSSLAYGSDVLQFTDSSPRTVTAINFGYNGQTITVRAKTTTITMQNNASIVNASGADLVLAAGKVARYTNIQGVWYQV